MWGDSSRTAVVGRGRDLSSGRAGEVRFELDEHTFRATVAGTPIVAAYRDLTTIAVQQGSVLIVLGAGAARILVDGLGDGLGLLLGELRERRARQMLADRFIELPRGEATALVEYASGGARGVGQLAYHQWGACLLPLDERQPWQLIRRAAIGRVEGGVSRGLVRVETADRSDRRGGQALELAGLGAAAEVHGQRLAGLREAALADAAVIVATLLPDAPFETRRRAGQVLVDGRPAGPHELGDAWPLVEAAVLSEPTFADAYRVLAQRGGGPRWIALAPKRPGEPEHLAWFFVALPGNLVAMEIVSGGAHATYLFRAMAPEDDGGEEARMADDARRTVEKVSEALVDMRFLRQPIYLSAEQLADPRHVRSRLAIAALPSLQVARALFVGRLIHRDEASWERALEDAIAWSSSVRDDRARWQGGGSDSELDDEPPIEERT